MRDSLSFQSISRHNEKKQQADITRVHFPVPYLLRQLLVCSIGAGQLQHHLVHSKQKFQ
jgi:hypothetical protein